MAPTWLQEEIAMMSTQENQVMGTAWMSPVYVVGVTGKSLPSFPVLPGAFLLPPTHQPSPCMLRPQVISAPS